MPVTLLNGPAAEESVEMPRHAKHPPAGTKQQLRSSSLWLDQADGQAVGEGEEITLMGWGNAIMRRITKDATTGEVTAIDAGASGRRRRGRPRPPCWHAAHAAPPPLPPVP